MNIFEDAIVPETPKALPNEQLFVYIPICTIDNPGIVTFDDVDFRIDEHGRVYMKVSSTKNAKDIRDIFALLYGYREGESVEGKDPGAVFASVKIVDEKVDANKKSIAANTRSIEENGRVLLGHAALLKEINDKLDEETGVNEETVREIVTGELAQYDTSGAVDGKISAHNTDPESHQDLRTELRSISARLNAALNSEDVDLDQLSEIVAYIKSNKSLIDAITTAKVSKSEIVNDLVTNLGDRPLSAAQGVALKALIDELEAKVVTSVPTFDLAGMGLPTIPMEGDAVEVTISTAAITEALRRGALVQFTVNLNYKGMTFNGVTMAVHGSESGKGIYTCTYAWSPYLVGEQYPMIITIIVEETKITGMARFMWTEAEVPSEIDLSAFETAGTIVETYADDTTKTTVMEFDADGNPVKITDADGNETVLTW